MQNLSLLKTISQPFHETNHLSCNSSHFIRDADARIITFFDLLKNKSYVPISS